MRAYLSVAAFMLVIILLMAPVFMAPVFLAEEDNDKEIQKLLEQNKDLQKDLRRSVEQNQRLLDILEDISEQNEELLDLLDIQTMNITKYAPLAETAVEGMCYSGNPNITASGQRVEIGKTAAAGPDVEFGTKIIVPGKGTYEVQDRGGAIGNKDLDLTTETTSRAFGFGVREKEVIIIKPD